MSGIYIKDYGFVTYDEKDLFVFRDGLLGYPELQNFLPLSINDEEDNTLLYLQAIENDNVAFVVINPDVFIEDYALELREEEKKYLGITDETEVCCYLVMVIQEDPLENSVNLKCPLVVNTKTRQGMQVILENPAYTLSHKLGSFGSMTNSIG